MNTISRTWLQGAIFSLAVVSALSSFSAPINQAMKELAARQGELRKTFTRQVKDRDFAGARSTAEELLASAKTAEAPAMREGSVAAFVGLAFANPVNVRVLDDAKHYLAVAIEKSTDPVEKAKSQFALLGLAVKTGAEADFRKNISAMRDFVVNVEMPPADKVRFLLNTVWIAEYPMDIDYIALADGVAGTNSQARAAFYGDAGGGVYRRMVDAMKADSLDPKMSTEARLAFVERALADPYFLDKSKFAEYKVNALVSLGRLDDAEKYILAGAASTNAPLEASAWQKLLGDYYVSAATRYYARPNHDLRMKAIGAYARASFDPCPVKNVKASLVDIAIAEGEFEIAEKAIASMLADARGVTNAAVAVRMGELAYAKRDYAAAAEAFAMAKTSDMKVVEKLATSLYVLGRYDECVPYLEVLSSQKNHNRYTRPYFAYCLQKLRSDGKIK